MTTSSAKTMLLAASVLVIGFGALLVMAAHPATDGIVLFFADLLFWPLDGAQSLDTPETRLINGISGGVMVGWGTILLGLSTKGLREAPDFSLSLIERSILVWFVIDSAASWIAGAPLNIIGNLVFLGLFLRPARALRYHKEQTTPAQA